jgi:hypothetical protein
MRVIAPAIRVPVPVSAVALLAWLTCTACPGTLAYPADAFLQPDDAGVTTSEAGTGPAGSCPDIPTTFAHSCGVSGCHDSTTKAQGLDLSSPGVASRLVGVPASEGAGFLIDATVPANSVVYTKLTSTPPFGARMPLTGPLDDATVQCVLTWVTAEVGSGQPVADGGGPPVTDGSPAGQDAEAGPTFSTIRVAAGQTAAVNDAQGSAWAADSDFTGGTAYVESTPVAISGTDTPALYNGQRYGNPAFSYQFTVPNGTYTVTMKFAELYVNGPGMREFGIAINGTTVETNFDIFATAGAMNTAIDKSYPVTVSGGTIQIDFTAGAVQFPKIDAIEIGQGSGGNDAGM